MTRRVLLLGGAADGMWVPVDDKVLIILMAEAVKFSQPSPTTKPQPIHEYRILKLSDDTGAYWVGVPCGSDASVMQTLLDGYQAKGGA